MITKTYDHQIVRSSGDGGNRTRVRKNRPSEIYERSRSKWVTAGISSGTNHLRPVVVSFARLTTSRAALRVCLARAGPWRSSGPVDAVLLEDRTVNDSLMQRGAWQRRKCDWHLRVCAELTRSAPLGSHSGTSLSRRSLSSPKSGDFPQRAGTFPGGNVSC